MKLVKKYFIFLFIFVLFGTLITNVLTVEAESPIVEEIQGKTVYVAPNVEYGNSLATGTEANPMNLIRAIERATAGDTIILLDGSYKCLDDTSNCVYLEQTPEKKEDGSYKYSVYIEVKESNNEIIIESIFGTLNNDLEESKELTAYQITELLKAYYDSKEMIDKDNLEYWNTNKVSLYARKENSEIFHYEGAYKCIDNSSDCIYIEQTNDSENNEYKIDLYIEIIDNSILQISGLYIDDNLTIIDQEIN